MNVLYIIKRDLDDTARRLIEQHRQQADVLVIDIRETRDYDAIVKRVFSSDKVICW